MFEFLNTPPLQLASFLYILMVLVSLIYAFVLSEYWFIVRVLVGLVVAGITLLAGEYIRVHETVPQILQIFPLSSIFPNNVFTVFALYGITVLILLLVINPVFRILSRAWKEKDTTLAREHSFLISPYVGYVPGIEFVSAEGKCPLFRVYYKRNGTLSELALRLDLDKGVFIREDDWSREEWEALEKVSPLVIKEINKTFAELTKIRVLP